MNLYHRPVTDSARFLHEELEAIIAHWIGNQRIDKEDFIEIKCRMESGWADYCKKRVSFSDVKRTAEKMANYYERLGYPGHARAILAQLPRENQLSVTGVFQTTVSGEISRNHTRCDSTAQSLLSRAGLPVITGQPVYVSQEGRRNDIEFLSLIVLGLGVAGFILSLTQSISPLGCRAVFVRLEILVIKGVIEHWWKLGFV
ncbi:hypothetical protein [Candidatus Coxiella mudrowiae]|uniref:Uncharacterized protein n=1 Tax=Candidatus Coxiella mudrowiae TaxID=2054173 RepID=A0ABN4HWI0_9COXI|nr:hypothetical protein [Candidatus Coxiella mudrowiae]AKQ33344.1 hypothetical protein CleRT_03840 [Candidatus Coxiella mudrowiae]AKQ33773.1 hypothetical protein CleRT_11200 [Candidatus Coxiella mudrowiae]